MSCLPVKQIHFELSSRCNAACQLCPRHVITEHGYHRSPRLVERDLPLAIIERLLEDPALDACNLWFLCGNLGEPMMHPDILHIVRQLLYRDENQWISMHTNGGIGAVDTWRCLGDIMQQYQGQIIFSIDGLEDTNHMYRRNVGWDTIMRNSAAFISAGGSAVWKFIEFDYNRHQITAARTRAKQLGFARFAVDKNSSGPLEPDPALGYIHSVIADSEDRVSDLDLETLNAVYRRDTVLDCEHVQHQSIYIDAQARVWPCCHLANVFTDGNINRRRLAAHYMLEPYGIDWNDLHVHDLSSILHSRYWADLYESLPGNSGLFKCSHSCGTKTARTRDRIPEVL